ncbi:MAG: SDR family oxidoreductase [Planctomycetota bacterium]
MSGRVLVTGGAGFIGSHLVRALLRRGERVTVIDDYSTGSRSNLEGLDGDIAVVEGSVADAAAVGDAMREVSIAFHLAAVPSVPRSIEAPLASHESNATGTVLVLDAARRAGARVVYAGSSSAYGNKQERRKREDLREDPISPYAASKLAGELYCRSFARVYGLSVVVTRFFNVFGPRQRADSPYSGVIAAFCHALLSGQRPRVDGDGRQSRDFTFVEDLVDGLLRVIDVPTSGCETVNLAYGESHDLLEVLGLLQQWAGTSLEPRFAPPRAGDVRHSMADVEKAKSLFGFAPRVGFSEGLKRTLDWYRSQCQ